MNEVMVFKNDELGFELSGGMFNGELGFIAKTVAEQLQYADTDQAVRGHCKYAETHPVKMTDQVRHMTIIPESDLYRLVLGCQKPEAEPFQDWVVEDVLPSIRKTGNYSVSGNSAITQPVVEMFRKIVREELAAHSGKRVSTIEREVDRVELTELPAHNWCGNSEESIEDKTERYILHHLGRFGEMTKSQINQYTIWSNKEIRDSVLGKLIEEGVISVFRVGRAVMFSLIEDETSSCCIS